MTSLKTRLTFLLLATLLPLFTEANAFAEAPTSCPQSVSVEISGLAQAPLNETIQSHESLRKSWESLAGLKTLSYHLHLFATDRPAFSSIACMSHPGACLTCFYHDDQDPNDSNRIHELHYQPSGSGLFWMNTSVSVKTEIFPFGFYLKSFSDKEVVMAPRQSSILEKSDQIDPACTPTLAGDTQFPCATVTEALATFDHIRIR